MRLVVSAAVCALAACTASTPEAGSSSSSSSTSAGPASVPDAGHTAHVPDAGEVEEPDAGPPPTMLLAIGLTVDSVAVYQSVKISVVEDGVEVEQNAPIIAGKAALIRVGVVEESDWNRAAVTARLTLTDGAGMHTYEDTRAPQLPASDGNVQSWFAFNVPAGVLAEDTQFSVMLTSPDGKPVSETDDGARFPRDGSSTLLGVLADPGTINLVLVPVQYDRDGSGRLPDTSEAQLAMIRSLLTAVYPVVDVTITVHDPLPWDRALTFTGNVNFGALNGALEDLRTTDNAPSDAYYYALITPADTYDDYCGNSCVTGQSYVVDDPADGDIRVGGGMGYSGEDSVWTLIHEVGHLHGREHAPCDVSSWDPEYPYEDASIGVWGHDLRTGAWLDPAVFTDFMGYCDDNWVSDYTYAALDERIRAVNGIAMQSAPVRLPMAVLDVGDDGNWEHVSRRIYASNVGRTGVDARILDGSGALLGTIHTRMLRRSDGTFRVAVPIASSSAAFVELPDPSGKSTVRVALTP